MIEECTEKVGVKGIEGSRSGFQIVLFLGHPLKCGFYSIVWILNKSFNGCPLVTQQRDGFQFPHRDFNTVECSVHSARYTTVSKHCIVWAGSSAEVCIRWWRHEHVCSMMMTCVIWNNWSESRYSVHRCLACGRPTTGLLTTPKEHYVMNHRGLAPNISDTMFVSHPVLRLQLAWFSPRCKQGQQHATGGAALPDPPENSSWKAVWKCAGSENVVHETIL